MHEGIVIMGTCELSSKAAGGNDGLRRLAYAWHKRVMADDDETTVVKMHSGNGEHDEMNRRAIACFDVPLADVGLANNNVLRLVLHGRPRQRCPATTIPPMMCRTA
jgi:hypothetical protein